MTNFGMTGRRTRPKKVPIAAMDFVQQVKILKGVGGKTVSISFYNTYGRELCACHKTDIIPNQQLQISEKTRKGNRKRSK